MSLPIVQRISANPFLLFGAAPSVSSRDLRHRFDELEILASLGDTHVDLQELVQARHVLDLPISRLTAEFLAPWADDPEYGSVAEPHDALLEKTRVSLARSSSPNRETVLALIRGWLEVISDSQVRAVVQRRMGTLDIEGDSAAWMRSMVSKSIHPAVVQQALSAGTVRPGELIATLCALREVNSAPSIHLASEYVCSGLTFSDSNPPSPRDLHAAMDSLGASMTVLGRQHPDQWRDIAERLVRAVNTAVSNLFDDGEIVSAGKLVARLSEVSLPEDLQIQVTRDLRQLRYISAWTEANEHAKDGEWYRTITALERARVNAQTPQESAAVEEAMQSARWASARRMKGTKSRPAYYAPQIPAPRARARVKGRLEQRTVHVLNEAINAIRAHAVAAAMLVAVLIGVVVVISVMAERDEAQASEATARFEQGMTAFRAEDYEVAITHFQAADRDNRASAMLTQALRLRDQSAAYLRGIAAVEEGNWDAALSDFEAAGTYKDTDDQVIVLQHARTYDDGLRLLDDGLLDEAEEAFELASGYDDAEERIAYIKNRRAYEHGIALINMVQEADQPADKLDQLAQARDEFEKADGYEDAIEQIKLCDEEITRTERWLVGIEAEKEGNFIKAEEEYIAAGQSALAQGVASKAEQQRHYEAGLEALASGDYTAAHAAFSEAGPFRDAAVRARRAHTHIEQQAAYEAGEAALKADNWDAAIEHFTLAGGYEDASDRIVEAETSRHIAALYGGATAAMAEGRWVDAYGTLTEINSLHSGYEDVGSLMRSIESRVSGPLVFDLSMLHAGNNWSTTQWVTNVLGENLFEFRFSRSWGHVDNDSLVMGVQLYPEEGFLNFFGLGFLAEPFEDSETTARIDYIAAWGKTYVGPRWNNYNVSAHIVSMDVEWNPTLFDNYYYPGAVFRSLVIELTLTK